MSTQRLYLTLLSGLLLVFLSGCGGGGTGGTRDGANGRGGGGDSGKKGNGDGTSLPGTVWLDNYAERACVVTVDGENKGTLEPFGNLQLAVAPGPHTFVLSCEGQDAETVKTDIVAGMVALVRPSATVGDYLITTLDGTSSAGDKTVRTFHESFASKKGVVLADCGPFDAFPPAASGREGGKQKSLTQIVRSKPSDMGLPELEHFIFNDPRLYGMTKAEDHRKSVLFRLKGLESLGKEPTVGDMLIRVADRLSVCAAGNADLAAIGDAILKLLNLQEERIPEEKLIAWLGIDPQTGKARTLKEGEGVNPPIADVAVSLLLKRGKQHLLMDCFPALTEESARAVFRNLANPPTPDEVRRRMVVAGLGRIEAGILKDACAVLDEKDFVPDEAMVEALTATIDRLDPNKDADRATIKSCSSCMVDAFYRHPAVVARPATRRFLVRFADPQLEPTLENARNALIDGRCAGDLVPIYTHFTSDARIDMVGYLLAACRKRKAVGPDVIELERVSLADEDTEVRLTAANALPQFAAFLTQENLPALQDLVVRALSDPAVEVQCEAARTLEVAGFVPTEQIADRLVAAWHLIDASDPQGQAQRSGLVQSLKTGFEKNPGVEADRSWRERALEALAQ